jgi:protein required for attachment to host cells
MKSIVTWVVLANTRNASVLVNLGPGKGISPLQGCYWNAEVSPEFRDKAGIGHSIAGPSTAAVDDGDLQLESDRRFAKQVTQDLEQAFASKKFDRLIIISGPRMLGLLRASLSNQLRAGLNGEIAKDLSALPLNVIEKHLGEVIAV